MLLIGNPPGKSFSSDIFSGISHSASCHTQRYVPALLLGDAGAPAAGSVRRLQLWASALPRPSPGHGSGGEVLGLTEQHIGASTDACASGEEKDIPPDSLSNESLY